ncbi:MAG TPA: hypothetical protein ENJ91_08145, partial [Rhodobacteraceae bacterium]|nr:hypothetical protein [Paracoccaceae bacterium]
PNPRIATVTAINDDPQIMPSAQRRSQLIKLVCILKTHFKGLFSLKENKMKSFKDFGGKVPRTRGAPFRSV